MNEGSNKWMVSVIVPIQNRETTLPMCVNSILAQSYQNFELILVDDGSTDLSGEICDRYVQLDQRVHAIHTKNSGPSAARNRGMELSQGDLIMFCDSDDVVEPEWIELLVECMKDPNIVLAVSDYYFIEKKRKRRAVGLNRAHSFPMKMVPFCVKKYGLQSVCHCCYRKTYTRFDESLTYAEDHVFNLNYIINQFADNHNGRIQYISKPLYNYDLETQGSMCKIAAYKHRALRSEALLIKKFAQTYDYSETELHEIEVECDLLNCKYEIGMISENKFDIHRIRMYIKSPLWEEYIKSMEGSPRYQWLCKRNSPILMIIFHQYYVPLRENFAAMSQHIMRVVKSIGNGN